MNKIGLQKISIKLVIRINIISLLRIIHSNKLVKICYVKYFSFVLYYVYNICILKKDPWIYVIFNLRKIIKMLNVETSI